MSTGTDRVAGPLAPPQRSAARADVDRPAVRVGRTIRTAALGTSIDLNDVIPGLGRGGTTTLEFYEPTGTITRTLTDLGRDVRVAAAALARLGLRARARVGILGTTSYQWVVVDLACLANGLVTVPLDPDIDWDRSTVAARFELALVLTNRPSDAGAGGEFVTFASVCDGDAGDAPPIEPSRWGPDEPFTVIFTSGTSGEPKVIEVRKRCFDDQFSNALEMFRIDASDRMLVFLPMHIYLERCYVYLAILRGFPVVVVSPRFVVKALKQAGLTFTIGVPHFFVTLQELFLLQIAQRAVLRWRVRARLLAERAGLAFLTRKPLAPFQAMLGGRARFFLSGSAPCPLPTLRFYRAMGIPLYEGYGMSEIAGMIALNYPGHARLGTVGPVFPNKEVAIDADGQILVRGENAANTRYWRAAAETNASTFLPDGWVATGDVGHLDADGYLTIDGRIKDVVVLSNGKKVQPEPIETRINEGPGIDASVVVGNERPYLVALVTTKTAAVDHARIAEHIAQVNASLPEGDRVKSHRVLSERFTVENGLVTRAFKLNRREIARRHAALIDELYAS